MIGMVLHPIGGTLRIVRWLLTQIYARPANSPVLHARDAILAVEFAVPGVTRVPELSGPDLLPCPVIPAENRHRTRRIADPVGLVRCARFHLFRRRLIDGISPRHGAIHAN